jgi:hypothetical protein
MTPDALPSPVDGAPGSGVPILGSEPFSTSDEELAFYLKMEQPSSSEREAVVKSLLARPPSERAQLLVHVCDLISHCEALRTRDSAQYRAYTSHINQAFFLFRSFFSKAYDSESLGVMASRFDFILRHFKFNNFSELVFAEHERKPSEASAALLRLLSGEQSSHYFLQAPGTAGRSRKELQLIERAHEALGNPPGSHLLSQTAAREEEEYRQELKRIVAYSDPVILPYVRMLASLKSNNAAENAARQSDKKLLLQDLQEQSPESRGTAFLSALEVSQLAASSALLKPGPQVGIENVRHAQLLASLPSDLKLLALELAKRKLVLPPDSALQLLRTCATKKLDIGHGHSAVPAQFWNSLGNSLPKGGAEVLQILSSAPAITAKRKQSLLIMAGLSSEEILRDEVADKYQRELATAQGELSSLLSDFGRRASPVARKPGILGRLFSSVQPRNTEEAWKLCWGFTWPLQRLVCSLPAAYYCGLDTGPAEELLADCKRHCSMVLEQHGHHADFETAEDAHAMAMSLGHRNPAQAAAEGLSVILPVEQMALGFRQFSAREREALRDLAIRFHPLPGSGKPSARWLDALEDVSFDDILDRWLKVVAPVSSKDDDIIVAAVSAAARMPGVATETLEQLVNAGFDDAPHGKRHERLANAALWVLSQRRGEEAIAAMRRIAETCRFIAGRDSAASYLKTMIKGDADNPVLNGEMLLPALDIWPQPHRQVFAGGHAVFSYNAPDRLSLSWEGPGGSSSANPTAEMKSADAASVKRLKKLVPQLERTLQAHIRWIERLYLSGASFRFDEWQERYLLHQTRGALARHLIWRATGEDGSSFSFIPVENGFHDAAGNRLDPSGRAISLWHPLDEPEAVQGWRSFLVRKALPQPFAQAFRTADFEKTLDEVIRFVSGARIEHNRWQGDIAALAGCYDWILSKKINERQTAPIKLHLFDPVSRLYVETAITGTAEAGGLVRWFELSDVVLARGDLGAAPTKAGLKKSKRLDPLELTPVQRAEVARRLLGLLSERFMDPADTQPRSHRGYRPFAEVPFIRPMAEERAIATKAYAGLLADPRAARTWQRKADGEDRIWLQHDGRLRVNGVENSYIFCPYENRICGVADLADWRCRIAEVPLESAFNVPFGLDPLLRRMTATVQLLTKDDRPGNNQLVKGR